MSFLLTLFFTFNFISVQDIDTIFACMVWFSGSANSNMLSKFSREPKVLIWHWQPNLDKPKLHKFYSYARNQVIFRMSSRFIGVSEFKYAICIFQGASCHGNQVWSKIPQTCTDFSSGEFKCVIWIFNGAKGVAMATKFKQKINQNCTNFSSVQDMVRVFARNVKFQGRRSQTGYLKF